MKICRLEKGKKFKCCGALKPIEEFYKHPNMADGHLNQCKDCSKRYEYSRKTQRKNNKLVYDYGITLADYNKKLIEQNYSCAICLRHESFFKKKLFVDHHHESGTVRMLLCNSCNILIGHSFESPELLKRAIAYLEK